MNIAVQPPVAHEPSIALKPAELDALRANLWFSALPIELQRGILRRCAIWHVPAHQTLGTQSSVPDVWFGVAAGAVALSTQSSRGRQTIVDLLEPGQWFGDVPLLSGLPAPYEARTWAPSTLLLMRRSTLRELLGDRPELGPALLHLNWCRSARLIERITDQREPLLEQQARQLLARLTSRFGLPGRDATRITLSMTQSQIALLLGSSRQRTNQALKRLERQGVFRRSQQSIIVPHRPTRSTTP
ncbi:Crp/Fnr family transcriptional regulator [Variovorax paradoxus]|uniref:Crp/Fnr family transcriptional regulator n=1 Tax=Variovorax paradoxus TaxID=34073 RepID=UPI003AADBC2D